MRSLKELDDAMVRRLTRPPRHWPRLGLWSQAFVNTVDTGCACVGTIVGMYWLFLPRIYPYIIEQHPNFFDCRVGVYCILMGLGFWFLSIYRWRGWYRLKKGRL